MDGLKMTHEFLYYERAHSGSVLVDSKSYLPPKIKGGFGVRANNSKMLRVLIASLRPQYQQLACQYQYCQGMGGI